MKHNLKQKSVEKSVVLSVERNGVSVEQHIKAMSDIMSDGLPAFIEHMQALQGKHITKQEADKRIGAVEPPMQELCDNLMQSFKEGQKNG